MDSTKKHILQTLLEIQSQILEIDDNQKLLFLYDANGEELIFSGFRDDVVKEGIRIF